MFLSPPQPHHHRHRHAHSQKNTRRSQPRAVTFTARRGDSSAAPAGQERGDLAHPRHLPEVARARFSDGGRRRQRGAARRGVGGVRPVVPGDPGRGLGARRLRPRLLLALQEGVLLLPRFPRDAGGGGLRPLMPALQLRLPRAPLPQVHRPR